MQIPHTPACGPHNSRMHAPPRIALALGDPGGISYAVTARALHDFSGAQVQLFGDLKHYRAVCERLGLAGVATKAVPGEHISGTGPYRPAPDAENGRVALASLITALAAVQRGTADILVTAPLSKSAVRHHQPDFTGHTEFLRASCGGAPVIMSFFAERFKVALHTTHIPLREVWAQLTRESLVAGLTRLDGEWRRLYGAMPRIGLAGLNPHAGEGGAFGDEEIKILLPAAAAARAAGLEVSDPLPPDTLTRQRGFDIFYCLYHDQGLIAAKALPEEAAHVTLGLPFIRTSPDHGVAYDLAATPEKASADGMAAALNWAVRLHAATQKI